MHSFSIYLLIFKNFFFVFAGLTGTNCEQEKANVVFLAAFYKIVDDDEEALVKNVAEGVKPAEEMPGIMDDSVSENDKSPEEGRCFSSSNLILAKAGDNTSKNDGVVGGTSNLADNGSDKASDDEEYHEAASNESNDVATRPCTADGKPMSEDEGLGEDSDDEDPFEVNSDDGNDGVSNNNDEVRARLYDTMMECLTNDAVRVNNGGSDISDRIRAYLSDRIKETLTTNVVDPDNLVDEERRTPETFGLKSIGFKPF